METKDNKAGADFFAAMNTETHKIMEMFGGQNGTQYLDNLNSAWTKLLSGKHDPAWWMNALGEYQKTQLQFWGNLFGSQAGSAGSDRRFKADEWSASPVFNYIKESYLIAANMLNRLVSQSHHLDDKTRRRLEFYTQQYIDAMSPSNFAATNPEVIKRAVETRGQSLMDGLKQMMGDMEKGRISMTDESAFELGKNLALTPGEVIFENELMQLIQYRPATDKVAERPTLIVPPCINKFYILDLQPDNSFVRYAVEQGQTVFLISWVNAKPDIGHLGWDDYVERGVFKALEVVKAITGSDRINTVAWCIGGTILASALAVMAARKDNSVASATFLTTLTDFSEPGDLGIFIDEKEVPETIRKIRKEGILSGRSLSSTFNLLRSNDLIWSYVVNNYLKGVAPAPFDILYWNSDPTNLPAEMYSYYITNMYLNNSLSTPGGLTVCGEPVDLGSIKTPCYFLSCIEDHIAPWKSTFIGMTRFSNAEFVLGASGHIAGVINPASKNRRSYWINGNMGDGADAWLESAESQQGSWWNHWNAWIKKRAGKKIEAPSSVGSSQYPPIEQAPGRYVAERIV